MANTKRSNKAREKFADYLLSSSKTTATTTLLALLVLPLTGFIQAVWSDDPVPSFIDCIRRITARIDLASFAFVLLSPLALARWTREQALNIYDELARSGASSLPSES